MTGMDKERAPGTDELQGERITVAGYIIGKCTILKEFAEHRYEAR